ncbi:MAG: beta galactosidase jelly roll domain-containing protein [Clostridiales bacterium]|nr:beta galactosidase jelly roll domain-containing protein [Clostridiales bacterium]
MEYYGQNYGLIYYETVLSGKYDISPVSFRGVHDFGYVYFDGKLKTRIDRTKYTIEPKGLKKLFPGKKSGKMLMPALNGNRKIGVLVDIMGRVNYGDKMEDRKGITDIYIGNQRQMGYDVYTIPLDNLENLKYEKSKDKLPLFMKGTFKSSSKDDCFVHLNGFKKGYVWINGFNLGRYWEIGPQKSLYLPGALLKDENEITVLEMEGFSSPFVSILDKHDLG